MKDKIQFDMDAALAGLREGKGLSGKDGILTALIKQLTEAAMHRQDGGLSALELGLQIREPYQAKVAWPLEHSPTPHLEMYHVPYNQAILAHRQ